MDGRVSRRSFLAGAVLGSYVVVGTSLTWPLVAPRRMVVVAHHGDLDSFPENTLEGLVAAMAHRPDVIEFDVGRSADGTFWLAHDHKVDATTDGRGFLADLPDRLIRELTITGGAGFEAPRHVGMRMTTMDDALIGLSDWRGGIMVDLKDEGADAHRGLMTELEGRVDASRLMVIARSIEGASIVKAADRRIRTLTQGLDFWHPDVDIYLANAALRVSWPTTTVADLFGDVCMYVPDGHPGDERHLIKTGQRWGVGMVITNHLATTIAELHGGQGVVIERVMPGM